MTKPDDILSLFREMSVQETPEAAATAALAWALRHAPVDGGALEISGHRIERIAPEPDPWPTAPLIVATFLDKRCVFGRTSIESYDSPTARLEAYPEAATLTDVVPVTVVAAAEWEAWRKEEARRVSYGYPQTAEAIFLIRATDALGLDQ